jgi:hypothetical protein
VVQLPKRFTDETQGANGEIPEDTAAQTLIILQKNPRKVTLPGINTN